MNLYSPIAIKSIFQKYNIKPKKYLGQNFVINESVIDDIVKTADLNASDTVIEIGPGLGALTIKLAKKTKQVIAIEKDKMMCKILNELLKKENIKNVAIINADILDHKSWRPEIENWKLVANIPYYITQPIIRLFLESETPPQSITLLVQKEVAQRICAIAPKMNLLAICVQFYSQPKIISYVSKNNFWPQPKVDSAILNISQINPVRSLHKVLNLAFATQSAKRPSPRQTAKYSVSNGINRKLPDASLLNFFKTVRAGFSSPRKMLIGNLCKKLEIPREIILKTYQNIGINPEARAENLTVKDWGELSIAIFSHLAENMV